MEDPFGKIKTQQSDIDVCSDVESVPFREALGVWLKVAINSFGGPTGQIAVMHHYIVEDKKWISEARFLHALNYCMLLPGPEAQQLATYIGWLVHRTIGGIIAGTLFVLPGFLSILGLSVLYAGYNEVDVVKNLFWGLKPAVLAVVLAAVIRISGKALKNRAMVLVAAVAFVAIFFFKVPFPFIIAAAGVVGFLGSRYKPEVFALHSKHVAKLASDSVPTLVPDDCILEHTLPTRTRNIGVVFIFAALWFLPIFILAAILGRQNIYVQEALFFSKAAVVTFGGAYAVLAYIAQQAVDTYGWLYPGEMLDGLGLAETTPGPLIQVVQFVGFLGAYRNPGPLDPMLAGIIASILVTWVTFVPCYLWIFLGAPYIEKLRGNKSLNGALSAITAAVVGVVLNLAVWFSLHVLFGTVQEIHSVGLRLFVPHPTTISVPSLIIAGLAFVALFRFKLGVIPVIAASAATGIASSLW
jgi:chromate transporter